MPATAMQTALSRPQPDFSDRRREPRFECDDVAAEVRTETFCLKGRVLDISRSGLRLAVPEALTAGSEVTVYFNRVVAACEVRYCTVSEAGWFDAGLQMQDVMQTA
jgi:hypothetical protein